MPPPKRMWMAPPKCRTAPTPKRTSQKQNARVPCGASLPIRTPPNVPLPRVMMAALRLARTTWASVPSTMLQLLPWRGCAGPRLHIGLRLPGRRPSQPLCLLPTRPNLSSLFQRIGILRAEAPGGAIDQTAAAAGHQRARGRGAPRRAHAPAPDGPALRRPLWSSGKCC